MTIKYNALPTEIEMLTPNKTQNELNHGVLFVVVVDTHGNGRLRDHNRTNVVRTANRRNLVPVEQFEDVHNGEQLCTHNHDIPQSCCASFYIRRVWCGLANQDGQ